MTEPSFEELEQLIFLARAYTENCSGVDEDGPEWAEEWALVAKAEMWLQWLKLVDANPAGKIALAMAVLEASGSTEGKKSVWTPQMEKVLAVSTGHISEETAKHLTDDLDDFQSLCGLVIYEKDSFGWWIYVSDEDLMEEKVPEELAACLAHARMLGCRWLCLDCDAAQIDELPKFSW